MMGTKEQSPLPSSLKELADELDNTTTTLRAAMHRITSITDQVGGAASIVEEHGWVCIKLPEDNTIHYYRFLRYIPFKKESS
jgi:hypothetical protein